MNISITPMSLSRRINSGMMRGVAFFVFLMLLSGQVAAQEGISGVPFSVDYQIPRLDTYERMPNIHQPKKAMQQPEVTDRLKRLQFAHVFDLLLHPGNSGEWIVLGDGSRIWRLGIASPGAYSLSFIFGRYRLAPDVKLFIYTPGGEHILGAFSAHNNNAVQTLAIEPLPGDSAVIELNVPAHSGLFGELELTRAGHDFVNVFSMFKTALGTSASGTCNADINCEQGLEWQREKYAVCKLIVNARDLCTGTLINNTAADKTPYVFTANHCIDTTIKAANTVFIFNYEKWKCGGQDGPKPVTISGSQLIATTPRLDFSLVKLYGLPPFSVRPYLAGWDRSTVPPQKSVTIHHPSGDYKKISIDDHPAVSATFEEDYNPNTHWLINRWEVGTTERGSSGGPLFNQNRHIVGDLTGGDATCTSPVRDYFAKFSNSWADYSDPKRQLKAWLDPMNTNATSLDGMDPYAVEKASCDTFRNTYPGENMVLISNNLTWGTYTGHSSRLNTQFAEKFNLGKLKIPGIYLHIAKAYNASPLSYITIKLWQGGEVPGAEISSRSVYIKDLTVNKVNFLAFDSVLFVTGPVFLGFSVNYSASQDTVAVYQVPNRGDSGYSGLFIFRDGTWQNISETTSPAVYSSMAAGLVSCSLINSAPGLRTTYEKLHVYPNPANDVLHVPLPHEGLPDVSVWDITGRKVGIEAHIVSDRMELNTSQLKTGSYILKVIYSGKGVYTARFMVIK